MSDDPPEANKKFKDKYAFCFPLLSDEERALPQLLDTDSRRWGAVFQDGELVHFWEDVNPDEFPAQCLECLKGGVWKQMKDFLWLPFDFLDRLKLLPSAVKALRQTPYE